MYNKHKTKKKILIFQPTIGPYRFDFFNRIAEESDLSIYLEYGVSKFEIFDNSNWSSFLYFQPKYLREIFSFKNRKLYGDYFDIIQTEDPDIIIVGEFGMEAIAAMIYRKIHKKKFKIISLCDDSHDILVKNKDFTQFHKWMRKLVVPRIDNLILVEPKAVEWYQQHYSKGIFFPIISDERITREKYKNALTQSVIDIEKNSLQGTKIILYVGRLEAIKNVEALINSFISIVDDNLRLVIVGSGTQENHLREISQSDLRIIFTGQLCNQFLYSWYNIAHILVLPSITEPFGAVVNEALLGGCKAIVSNTAGSRCLIQEGYNGYLFEPTNQEDLKHVLVECLKSIKTDTTLCLRDSLMTYEFEPQIHQLLKAIDVL